MVSSSLVVLAAPSSSEGGPLTPFSCYLGSLPGETSFVSPLSPFHIFHELLQHGSLVGSQVQAANLLHPAQALHGLTASFGHTHLLWSGISHDLQVDLCSFPMDPTLSLRGTSAPAPGTPLPLLLPTLVFPELLLSHIIFTPLSSCSQIGFFPHFLNTLSQRCFHHH